MSKKKADVEKPEPAAPVPAAGEWIVPKWALILGAVMLVTGSIAYAKKDESERAALLKAMNEARVQVSEVANGLERNFGETKLESHQKEYMEVLSAIASRPALAQDLFRTVLKTGTTNGRILACRMAPHLAHADLLSIEDIQEIAKQLSDKEALSLRCAAQDALTWLLAVADPAQGKTYETLKAKPQDPKERWQAKTFESEFFGRKFLMVKWSHPGATEAWFAEHAGGLKPDKHLKRFALGEAPKTEPAESAPAPEPPTPPKD